MSDYTKNLTAEQLIAYIANDYVELSHDKIVCQRDDYIKICKEWMKHQHQLSQLDPDKREWEYDGCGNRVYKSNNIRIYNDDF